MSRTTRQKHKLLPYTVSAIRWQ